MTAPVPSPPTLAQIVAALSVTYDDTGVLMWLSRYGYQIADNRLAEVAAAVARIGDADPADFRETRQTPDDSAAVPDEWVEVVARICEQQHGREYDASHLTWRDFARDAAETLAALWPLVVADRQAAVDAARREAHRLDERTQR